MSKAIVEVADGTEALARVNALEARFQQQRALQRQLDKWRHMDLPLAEAEIWRDIPNSARKRTIMKPDICSVTTTMVAFLTGRRPKIRTRPKNPLALQQLDAANFNERVGTALFDTLDRIAPQSLIGPSSESDVHRGELIYRALWLSPEERGEERQTLEPDYLPQDPENLTRILGSEPPAPEEVVVKEGRFPLQVDVLDPLECAYTLGQDGRVVEFVHHYWSTWAGVADAFPGIRDKDAFRNRFALTALDSAVEVIDYWTEDEHAILVDGKPFQEPKPHHYPRIPFIVELANARPVVINQTTNVTQWMGTPFCLPMLEPIRHMSWADSMKATYLEEAIFSKVKHMRIDPTKSPYMLKDPTTGESSYQFDLKLGPGSQIAPLFYDEDLAYVEPPPIVAVVQEFLQSRTRDASLTSFPESILSGAQTIDISGYAYSQMKQAAMARIEPYRMALDRALSRLLMLCNDIIVAWWDLGDVPLVLTELIATKDGTDQQEVALDKGAFLSVAGIDVTITPEVPINEDAEKALIFQSRQSGLMSKLTAVERLGYVQDASAELKRIAFETMADNDPTIMLALARAYMKENGIEGAAPPPQAAAPMAQPSPNPSPPPSSPAAGPLAAPTGMAPPAMPGGMGGLDPQMAQLVAQAKQQVPQLAGMPDEQVAQILMQQMQQSQPPQAVGA